ncbi:MAG: DUF3316 domain-containing protein [Prevotella sp.]|nr:DUF3316 domain-containing protein [Prevotella sp.]
MKLIRIFLNCFLVLAPLYLNAQERDSLENRKVIKNAQMIGIGGVGILDTYISQEKFSGFQVRYISHTIRSREEGHWSRLLLHQGYFSYADDRSEDGDELSGMYTFSYGVHYNWHFLSNHLNIRAGGQAEVYAGFLYNTRNSNNPAQARLGLEISPSAAASWQFRLGKHSSCVTYEFSVPLFGLMFSPNYGQSYYEIFSRGNYDHNVVPTTIGCIPSLRQMLTFDFTLGRTSFRVGYMGDFRQAKVNNLKYHEYSNLFLIGIVRTFSLTKIKQ